MPAVASVRHDPRRSRYEYVSNGMVVAVADYRVDDGVAVMHHTATDVAHRGQGIAARLVEGALDDLRRRGFRVMPTCWYVADFIDAHPEYQDLLVAGPPARRSPGPAGRVSESPGSGRDLRT